MNVFMRQVCSTSNQIWNNRENTNIYRIIAKIQPSNDFFRDNFRKNGHTKMIFAKIFAKTNFREFSSNLKNFSQISHFH
jgi:hypothetical protein